MEVLVSVMAKALIPFTQSVKSKIGQLHAARVAARDPLPVPTDMLKDSLRATLELFLGGNVEDAWWWRMLDELKLEYVAPDFFKKASVKNWLTLVDVQEGLIAIARAYVMGQTADDEPAIRKHLAHRYSEQTGEAVCFAEVPIDVVVATLTWGCIASIPRDQRPLAGMIQAVGGQVDGLSEERSRALIGEAFVRERLGKEAEDELAAILDLRLFDFPAALDRVRTLWRRLESGNLSVAPVSVKDKVCYWATRLHAEYVATVAEARRMRQTLSRPDAGGNQRILDALIKAAEGDVDVAMQLLRDENDQDARSVLLGILVRSEESAQALALCREACPTSTPSYLTDIGWRDWGIYLANSGRWDEAAAGLRALASKPKWAPVLAMTEGMVNAVLLLPGERRRLTLDGPPMIYAGIAPRVNAGARECHARSLECFAHVEKCLPEIGERFRQGLDHWHTWLRLLNPDSDVAAVSRDAIRKRMEGGNTEVRHVALAWAFGIKFDARALRAQLARRELLGGLSNDDILTECLLNQSTMAPRDLVTYLEQRRERIDRALKNSPTTTMLFEALLNVGQIERARALMEEFRESLDEESLARMEAALAAQQGIDSRKRFEDLYAESNEQIDLLNLIKYLKTVNDRAALEPLVRELFARAPTLDNAFEVVGVLSIPPTDHGSVVQFLEANPTILEHSEPMKSAQAWGYFSLGRVREAREINDGLLHRRKQLDDLTLDVNIAVATGDWERLAAIVNREWPRRAELDPEVLIMLARLASQCGLSAMRAVGLARLAAEKAPEDPHTLVAAHMIHIELGQDEASDPGWLAKALEQSSEAGPLWRSDLQTFVDDWLPRLRERNEDIERKLLQGDLPIAMAAGVLNTPLARLFLYEPPRGILDGRKRSIVPIVSGMRRPVDLQDDWTVGLDVTSIMVLARLGLLEKAIGVMGNVKVAPEVMECLIAERAAVRFHQPVRVKAAQQLRRLIDGGQITLVDGAILPDRDLIDEVGRDLAILFKASRDKGGVTVCVLPIHKAMSLTGEVANIPAYNDVILSPADLCELALRAGRIDTEQYEGAMAFLKSQGQQAGSAGAQSTLEGPIHLDDLALWYLQSAGILQPLAISSLDLRINSSVSEETNAFIEAGATGDDLAQALEGIRDALRSAMEADQMSLLPRSPERPESRLGSVPSVRSMEALIHSSGDCAALCVDDRYINSRVISEGFEGRPVPIICVLDVLRFLHTKHSICEDEYWTARHRLREAGFAFVPVEEEELLRHLRSAKFEAGKLLESAELRAIRQTVNRFDSLGLLSGEEARELSQGLAWTCSKVIEELWADVSLNVDVAAKLSTWIWRYLPITTYLAQSPPLTSESSASLEELVSRRLQAVLLGPITSSTERRAAYGHWLEQTVIAPLRSASLELVEAAAVDVLATIGRLDANRNLAGRLFLESLPEGLREKVVQASPRFASDCGFRSIRVLEMKGGVRVPETDLIGAAMEALDGVGTSEISDLAGIPVKVIRSKGGEELCVSWTNAHGLELSAAIPELTLLCGNAEARQRALREIVGHVGPTATSTRALLHEAESRKCTAQEVSSIIAEKATGVAATQTRLAQNITSGWPTSLHDLVPPSQAYWEGFCGPVPHQEDPEAYFATQLAPYRKSLIEAEFVTGLDICCLGALRDDLSPGAWLEAVDDETVLQALESLDSRGNPIVLLGVLDAALYRVKDSRFRRIAEQATTILLDDRLGLPQGYDGIRIFEVLVDFLCNRVSLLRGACRHPGFWRRMCAWMQAGLIVRSSVAGHVLPDIETLEQWCGRNVMPAGILRQLADCRLEPLVMGHVPGPGSLRIEIVSRLGLIRERHEEAGREVPMTTEIDGALSEAAGSTSRAMSAAPGPAEVHLRPCEPFPEQLAERIEESWEALDRTATLTRLARMSQFFIVEERICAQVRLAAEHLILRAGEMENGDASAQLYAVSIIAAATGDKEIADRVGNAISRIATASPRRENVETMVCTLLQAAAVFRDEREWFEWLQERLGELAAQLPSGPSKDDGLQWLFCMLERTGMALPVRSWCHTRALSLAAAGMETTT